MIIADLSMIGEILSLDLKEEYTLGIVERMRLGRSIFLLEDNARACVTYDPIHRGSHWVAHILSAKDFKGKVLWSFALETAAWMVRERGMEHIMCFIDNDDRVLRVFVRYFRMKRAAVIGEETIYTASAEQIKNFASQKEV
jgi:hypothetical protein